MNQIGVKIALPIFNRMKDDNSSSQFSLIRHSTSSQSPSITLVPKLFRAEYLLELSLWAIPLSSCNTTADVVYLHHIPHKQRHTHDLKDIEE